MTTIEDVLRRREAGDLAARGDDPVRFYGNEHEWHAAEERLGIHREHVFFRRLGELVFRCKCGLEDPDQC